MTENKPDKFIIKLAEQRIRIAPIHSEVFNLCRDYIVDGEDYDIDIVHSQADIDHERDTTEREMELGHPDKTDYQDSYLETLAVYRKIAEAMLDYDTILFHGSALAVDGKAVVFTGVSGTGKSTHAKLWTENIPGVTMINDDKPLVSFREDKAIVYGTPWDGKHKRSSNTCAELQAICLLHQAPENKVRELSWNDAYATLIKQTYTDEDSANLLKTIRLLQGFKQAGVRYYDVECNKDKEAALLVRNEVL